MVANEFKVARGTLAQYTAKKTSSQLDADTLYFFNGYQRNIFRSK